MNPKFFPRLLALLALLAIRPLAVRAAEAPAKLHSGRPLRVLLVTGGCCHNYAFQAGCLTNAVAQRADVRFTVVNEGGSGTRGEIALYDDPGWAKPYDVVVHNECFADTTNAAYIRRIVDAHRAGKPAVVVHCAMHTYRAWELDEWREFLGVTSRQHEHQARYAVKAVAAGHPAMGGFPARGWTTPMDELYVIEKLWPGARALATARSERTGKEQPVVWANDFHGTRVFGTTFGHSDDTFRDPAFLELLSRGIVWAAQSGKTNP
ncbi:MAG: ThuA domain-containing protein [Verrucomicrobia bacterium]|nr:MAG: ThuA domain-containing protein [Verrucomicrobiota bacterium]